MNRFDPPAVRAALAGLLFSAAPALAQAPSGQVYVPGKPAVQLPSDTGAPGMSVPRSGPASQIPSDTGVPEMPAPGGAPPAPSVPPGQPSAPPEAAPAMPPAAAPAAPTSALEAAAAAGAPAPFSGLGGGLAGSGAGLVEMLGDSPGPNRLVLRQVGPPVPPDVPPPGRPPVPGGPPNGILRSAAIVPSIRSPKICENQSPQPQDRVYFSFNYYEDVNRTLNQQLGSSLYNLRVYRELLGFEKTFFDGNGSLGMRLPIDSLSAASYVPFGGGTSTSVGNLSIILKYAFLWNRDTGSLISGGLMIDTPTGPSTFANFPNLIGINSTALVPYLGYIYNFGDAYFHGFSSIAVPTTSRDVTVLYNDLGVGYFLYRAENPESWLTAVVPAFETHINIPVNHTDYLNFNDPAGTPDVVNLTFGCNFGIGQRGLFTVGYVTPMTGPRPFDNEWLAMFNYRY